MSTFRNTLLAAVALTVGAAGAAQAALSFSSSVGGAPTGVTLDNLDWMTLGSGTPQGPSPQSGITVNLSPDALAVQGSVVNQYAAPFLSGGNGTGFGNPIGTDQPNGVDTTTYITSGSFGTTVGAAAWAICISACSGARWTTTTR